MPDVPVLELRPTDLWVCCEPRVTVEVAPEGDTVLILVLEVPELFTLLFTVVCPLLALEEEEDDLDTVEPEDWDDLDAEVPEDFAAPVDEVPADLETLPASLPELLLAELVDELLPVDLETLPEDELLPADLDTLPEDELLAADLETPLEDDPLPVDLETLLPVVLTVAASCASRTLRALTVCWADLETAVSAPGAGALATLSVNAFSGCIWP